MKSLFFNRTTLLGETQTPISLEVAVPDNFSLTKSVEEIKEYVQKENEKGEKLFFKDIYKTVVENVLDNYEETLEVTDYPSIITVQKADEDGDKLYLENVYDEEGVIVDTFETIDKINESTGQPNEPIMVEVHKTTTNGVPVYLEPVYTQVKSEVFDYVGEVTEETDQPIMLPKYQTEIKDVFGHPESFSLGEVVQAKYTEILNASRKDHIIVDNFFSEDEIDFADPNHSANTGMGIIELLPLGQLKTKSIALEAPTTSFEILEFDAGAGVDIYLSGKKFVDGKLELTAPVSNCTIKFVNTTDKPKLVNSYAIGY